MHHQSEIVKLFIVNSDLVEINSIGTAFYFEAKPSNYHGCNIIKCENCTFSKAKFCFITPEDKEYAEILAYFKTNHPEKLL